MIDARTRIGGRILTVRDSAISVPIELGAEFLHGSASGTQRVAREAGATICDINGDRVESTPRGFRLLDDFWQQLDRVMRKLDAKRRLDRSFAEFLAERPGGAALARARLLADMWVRGYQAANPERASERALADGGSPGNDESEQLQARVLEGYDTLPTHLAHLLGRALRLGSVVTHIEWEPGAVELTMASNEGGPVASVRARSAVISVPLGVLQAPADSGAAITFSPSLSDAKLDALHGLAEGHVVRVSVVLDEPIWMTRPPRVSTSGRSLRRLAFLHPSDGRMPVCWTGYPTNAPLLVAWFGGPEAESLSRLSRDEIEHRAVGGLARRLHVAPRRFVRHVRSTHMHNWSADPFSRGAYSYVVVGGADASRTLARPLKGTLFFAGEAFDSEGRNGTVEGAIASGRNAARQLRRTLGVTERGTGSGP